MSTGWGRARRWRGWAAGAAAAAVVVATGGTTALADDVVVGGNNVVADGGKVVTATPGKAVSVNYELDATSGPGNDPSGCDTGGGKDNAVTVTITVSAGATASPSSLSFGSCGTPQAVSFSAAKAGEYTVTASATGGKKDSAFTTDQASFKLKVVSPNTAPVVTVSGPEQGKGYEKGSVPAAVCNVTDDHDAATTFAATLSAVTGTLSSYGLGSQTASCSYTDAGGLGGQASVTYSVVDTKAPALKTPGDRTVEATGSAGAAVTFSATATDAVDPEPAVSCASSSGLTSGSTFPLGGTTVSCTATDEAGNASSGQFVVTVQDTTKPLVTVPDDVTAEATAASGAAVTYSARATDTVSGTLTPTCAPASGSTFALGGATAVVCQATDAANNTGYASFNVNVVDTTAPRLSLPENATIEATGASGAAFAYTATASDLVDGEVGVTCDAPSGSAFRLGSTTVSCAATDKAGNSALGSFVVTVQDKTAPVLTLPEDLTAEATKSTGADVSYSVSATDLVDGNVEPVCAPANGTFAVGTTTVSCTATDAHGNTARGSFHVVVTDTTPPTLVSVPADQILEATGPDGAVATFTPPTSTDLVDGIVPVTCSASSGATFVLGTTKVTCSATDAHSNRTTATFAVTVADTKPPVLTEVGDLTAEASGADGARVGFTAPTAHDVVDGAVDVACDHASGSSFAFGVTTVTCSAQDRAGNSATRTFTVTVQDTTAPDVTVPASRTEEATGPTGATVTWSGVSAHDVVDGDLSAGCTPASGSTFGLGTRTVTCSATDAHGNTGQGGFTVTVVDTTPPALTVPADMTAEATGPTGTAVRFAAVATDLVDGSVTPVCTSGGQAVTSGNVFPLGTATVSCTATDYAGNSSPAKAFTVTVQDTTAPVVTVPASQTVEATGPAGAVATWTASARDLVDGDLAPTCSVASGSVLPLGTTTVTCTATDAHRNLGSGSFTVTVRDTTAPVVSVPTAPVTATATSAAGATVTFTATATDTVDGTFAATCTPASGSTFTPGATTVSCTATDAAGNTADAKAFQVNVTFGWAGFFAPVDTNKTLNGMKAGSTAPLKWSVSDQKGGYVSDLSIVSKETSSVVNCSTGAVVDDLESYATGGTLLRYDSTANQFVYNWQSPKKAGTCYTVTIGLTDGTTHPATFQLK